MSGLRGCLRAVSGVVFGLGLLVLSARAEPDPIGVLANAICAGKSVAEIDATLTDLGPTGWLTNEGVAEAFGEASFLADLRRCVSPESIMAAYVGFKQGKDVHKLDVAFAMGHISDGPNGGTASVGFYDGSFSSVGSAGDPPSGFSGLGSAGDPPSGH